jgi:hypothetical protein
MWIGRYGGKQITKCCSYIREASQKLQPQEAAFLLLIGTCL